MRDWLIDIRKKKALKQKSVSDAVGVAQPTYCQYEHGIITPSVETAKKIGNFLEFDWTLFFEDILQFPSDGNLSIKSPLTSEHGRDSPS